MQITPNANGIKGHLNALRTATKKTTILQLNLIPLSEKKLFN